ncbi:MAG: DnaD domain protein, partial [Peptococcaceae bacterium]|nr:DnaD domain protein [Peptococcaceae bacterium]
VANLAVDVDEDVYVDVDDDVDVLELYKQQQQRQEDVVEPHWSIFGIVDGDSIYCYGKNRIPTTSREFLKIRDVAESLFNRYHTKRPTNQDVERVFEHVYRPAYNSNGEGYAVLDQARADLLEFAFSQASVQDQVKWSYIDTIMDKYSKNDITTAAQAQEYEYSRKRGEVA